MTADTYGGLQYLAYLSAAFEAHLVQCPHTGSSSTITPDGRPFHRYHAPDRDLSFIDALRNERDVRQGKTQTRSQRSKRPREAESEDDGALVGAGKERGACGSTRAEQDDGDVGSQKTSSGASHYTSHQDVSHSAYRHSTDDSGNSNNYLRLSHTATHAAVDPTDFSPYFPDAYLPIHPERSDIVHPPTPHDPYVRHLQQRKPRSLSINPTIANLQASATRSTVSLSPPFRVPGTGHVSIFEQYSPASLGSHASSMPNSPLRTQINGTPAQPLQYSPFSQPVPGLGESPIILEQGRLPVVTKRPENDLACMEERRNILHKDVRLIPTDVARFLLDE
jgi:hypothetical protein